MLLLRLFHQHHDFQTLKLKNLRHPDWNAHGSRQWHMHKFVSTHTNEYNVCWFLSENFICKAQVPVLGKHFVFAAKKSSRKYRLHFSAFEGGRGCKVKVARQQKIKNIMVVVLTCSNWVDLWATCTWVQVLSKDLPHAHWWGTYLILFHFHVQSALPVTQHELQQKIFSINKCDQRTKWLENKYHQIWDPACSSPVCQGAWMLRKTTFLSRPRGKLPKRCVSWMAESHTGGPSKIFRLTPWPLLSSEDFSLLQTLLNPPSDLRNWIHFAAGKRM